MTPPPKAARLPRAFKILAVILILFGLAVLLFHDKVSVSAAKSTNRLEIYYMYNEGESQSDWFAAAAERFKKLHPGLEIDILFAGREVLGKLRPRMIIGNPPDIVNQGGDGLEPLMEDGLFEPLDDALDTPAYGQDVPWRDTFLPGLLDIYQWQGRHYQLPAGLFCTVFFYNIEQFERFNLKPPRTWNEFLRVCQVLKDNGIEPLAADGTEAGYNVSWFSNLIGRVSNIPHIRATALNEPGTSWLEKPYVDAAKMIRELRDKGYIMRGYEGSKWPSAQMLWVQGKCGILLNGTWIPKEMKNKLPEGFRMGIFRFPIVEGYPGGDPNVQDINYESYAIPKGARHREIAIEFLKFVSSKEESKYLSEIDTPCGIKGVPMPASLNGLQEMLSPPHTLAKSLSGITSDLSEWYRIVARNNWSDLFLGSVDPEDMCKQLDQAQKRFYERMKALNKPSESLSTDSTIDIEPPPDASP